MAAANKKSALAKSIPKLIGARATFTQERITEEAKALLEWLKDDKEEDKKIYLGSFAKQRGYHRQRLSEFVKVNTFFADAYEFAKLWQEEKFIKNGLTRKWDATFTQFVMARVCAPEWKKSWDKDEEKPSVAPTIIINKIEK